jgi:hypothetical protein
MPIAARMMAASLRALRRDGGAAAVEMALLAPILVFLACGMVDFGVAVYTKMLVANAAQAGAAYAQFNGNAAGACTSNPCSPFGSNVQTVAQAFSPGNPFIGTISATATVYYCCLNSSGTVTLSGCTQPPITNKPSSCTSGPTPGIYVLVHTQANFNTLIPYNSVSNQFNLSFNFPTEMTSDDLIRVQ